MAREGSRVDDGCMSELRDRFAAGFGTDLAETIERAAEHHTKVLLPPLEQGSDPFRFALVWAIGSSA